MTRTQDPWDVIRRPKSRDLKARRGNGVWYAKDSDGRYHLLIATSYEDPLGRLFVTKGVVAEVCEFELRDEGRYGRWIDIVCLVSKAKDAFHELSRQISEVIESTSASRSRVVRNVLERWRWFWSDPAEQRPLSTTAAIGLFGELWFLRFWIGEPVGVRWWRGPLGTRHDFVHSAISVEAKATSIVGDGDVVHRISHIDQLDDQGTGLLTLFSLVLKCDPLGEHSLKSLVENVEEWLSDTDFSSLWRERVHYAGWSPAHAGEYGETYRVVEQRLFRVDEGFPRVVRSSFAEHTVPVGVSGITYRVTPRVVGQTHELAASALAAREILGPMRGSPVR